MRILVPVDGSEHSMRAAEYVARYLSNYPFAQITVLVVASFVEASLVSESPVTTEQFTNELVRTNKLHLEKAKAIFDEKGVQVKSLLLLGDPANVIINYAKENNINKIVMGSRGLSNFAGMVLGSVSHKVLAHVDMPVTIVK